MGRRCGLPALLRPAAVISAGAFVEAVLVATAEGSWARLRTLPHRPAADLETTLSDVATLAALAGWTWLLVAAVLTVIAALGGSGRPPLERAARRVAPHGTRRALAGLLGLGALAIPAATLPAGATRLESAPAVASAGVRWGQLHSRPPGAIVHGLPLPDRPTGTMPVRTVENRRPQTVVVMPGDTLWAIAARSLGPHASTTAIARAWPAWYAANRSAIGRDPDLIMPGTVLRPPAQHSNLPPDERP